MSRDQNPAPLGEKIATAENISEIHALLATGESYLNATQRTKNRWRRIAKKRKAQLQQQVT